MTTRSIPRANPQLGALSHNRPALDTFQNVGFRVAYNQPLTTFKLLSGSVSNSSGYRSDIRKAPGRDYGDLAMILLPVSYPIQNKFGFGVLPQSDTYDVSVQCRINGHDYELEETFKPHTSWRIATPADAIPNWHMNDRPVKE